MSQSMLSSSPSPPPLAVTGASSRIGALLRRHWGPQAARWMGRAPEDLRGTRTLLTLAGGARVPLRVNVTATQEALRAAQAAGVPRVLVMSSQAVYGRGDAGLSEDSPGAPLAPYGQAKQDMERAVLDAPEVTILRLGNVAGSDALLGALTGQTPVLDTFPDGRTPRRSYIGPATLAATLHALATHPGPLPRVLNLAAPGAIEMADLLRAAARTWTPRPAPPEALPEVVMPVGRLTALVPVPPATPGALVAEWRAEAQP